MANAHAHATSTMPATKAPRWISTEAGQWAWNAHDLWRHMAGRALSVQERRQLLGKAEQLYAVHANELA